MRSGSTKPKLAIWGASGHASVVADIVRLRSEYELVGFLDDADPERAGTGFCGATILGGRERLDDLLSEGIETIIVGFGDCEARLRLAELTRKRGFNLATAVHPRAVVADDTEIGAGTVVAAHALQWQEIKPVFCDVDPETHNLDPRRVEDLISSRTTGIIGVHLWGRPCDVETLTEISRCHGLKLLFDAAHAFGCSHRGRMIGNFGDAEVFSFHATKVFNTLEGGAVTTNDDELAAKVRIMRNFGFSGYDKVTYIGTNGKMNEVSAAVGLTSLESLDAFVATNRRNYESYREELLDVPGIELFAYDNVAKRNYQYVVLDVDDAIVDINRDDLVRILWVENVMARRYFYPGCHRMEPYRSHYPHAGLLLPVTEDLASRLLTLPTGTAIIPDQISTICGIIRTAISRGADIQESLAGE